MSLSRLWMFCMFLTLNVYQESLTGAGATTSNSAKSRTFRTVTNDAALSYLTQDMSNMASFKKDILDAFNTVRVSGTAQNKKVQKHIIKVLENRNWHIELDSFNDSTPYGVKEFTNIIATYDINKPRRIVLACHFDSKYFKNQRFVAATDSAVPCAILLETIRQLDCLLSKGPKDTSSVKDISLQLVFFDGEEAFKDWTETDSIYGARHLAAKWAQESDPNDPSNIKIISKIRELILLDLIGTSDTRIPKQKTETEDLYSQLFAIERKLRSKNLLKRPQVIFNGRNSWGGIEDDHKPFEQRGVDILHLISAPFPSVWHKLSDNWDNLDFDLIDDFSRIFRVFISNILHLRPENKGCRRKINSEL